MEFDLERYDIEIAKICISSASVASKANFNDYVAESTSVIRTELHLCPAHLILPE